MRRRLRATIALIALGVAVAALVIVGMSDQNWSGRAVARCLPARLHVSPQTVAPGESITVSSPAADCSLGYKRGHIYRVRLIHPGQPGPSLRTAVAEDGSFRVTLTVPPAFPSGPATVSVTGSPMDDCDDGGASCAGYAAYFAVE